MRLSRREEEYNMLRRLLQCLEECVERTNREHVDLVYDIYLIFSLGRCEAYFFADPSYVINTVVGSCVDLDDVHQGPAYDALADRAFVTWIAVDGRFAVYGSGEYLRDGSLTCSALT